MYRMLRALAPAALSLLLLGGAFTMGRGVAFRQVHGRPAQARSGGEAHAYFVATPSECEGLFDFLSVFERPAISRRVQFDTIYLMGDDRALESLRESLRARGTNVSAERAPLSVALQRRSLGYATAVLVVTDGHQRVVLAHAAPSTPDAAVDLARLLAEFPLPHTS